MKTKTALLIISTALSFVPRASAAAYDLYLSPDGDDANDGLTRATAKRTIEACYAAATNDAHVCVSAGTYVTVPNPPKLPAGELFNRCFFDTAYRLTFTAEDGNGKTFIVADDADEFRRSMAFYRGYQTFTGFTIRGMRGYTASATAENLQNTAPAFSFLELRSCVVEDASIGFRYGFGAFYACTFEDTVIRRVETRFWASMDGTSRRGGVFCYCSFAGCRIEDFTVANDGASRYLHFFLGQTEAWYSVFAVSPVLSPAKESGYYGLGNSAFVNCTFIWDQTDFSRLRVPPAKSENCYFCVGTGWTGTGGTGNAYAAAWNETYLDADYAPADIACPAIRMDLGPDAGWRESGLSLKKASSIYALEAVKKAGLACTSVSASLTVNADTALDPWVSAGDDADDRVLRIVNTSDAPVKLSLPAGPVYETFKGADPLTVPPASRNILTLTRTDDGVYLVSREELEVVR